MLLLEYSEKKYIFSGTPTKENPFRKRIVSFTYIFVQFCFNANKQKYVYST